MLIYTFVILAHSVPVDVPTQLSSLNAEDDLEFLAPSSLRSNSSFSSIRSFQHSPEGSNNNLSSLTRSGSLNSLNRRWLRTLTTSMEFGLQRMSEENVNKEDVSSISCLSFKHCNEYIMLKAFLCPLETHSQY